MRPIGDQLSSLQRFIEIPASWHDFCMTEISGMAERFGVDDHDPDEGSGFRRNEDRPADGLGMRSGASPRFASVGVGLFSGVVEKPFAQGGERCEQRTIGDE